MRTAVATRIDVKLLEDQYSRWKNNPEAVEPTWSAFFEGFELGLTEKPNGAAANGSAAAANGAAASPTPRLADLPLPTRVEGLVYAYRTIGHTIAKLDPLAEERPEQPLLSLGELGFQEKDLDLTVSSQFFLGGKVMKLREMIAALQRIYAGPIGFEFMHLQNIRVRNWLRERIEARPTETPASRDFQIALLRELLEAESFEHFLHTKYVGQKRFSLEGAESLMAALHTIFEDSPARGIQEIVMGMSHRGRLNVLANFLAKSFSMLFAEFSENYVPNLVGGDGDVKYHLGYTTTRKTSTGDEVAIRLASNPSHLEAVNSVVEGMARARQRILHDTEERRKVLPLLLHGDAAFAGQGIVAEVLNMSQLPGYRTGGTVHIIVNNQIGFTTLPADARSSNYATDVAKMIEAPVLHVNGDDPLAVAWCARLALEFRQQFKRDIVVDMYCYRRYGHNEADEPLFTQPSLYTEISAHPSVATLFRKQLIETGVLTGEQADALETEFESRLEQALQAVQEAEQQQDKSSFTGSTAIFQPSYSHEPVPTGVPIERLDQIVKALTTVPESFHLLPKVKRTVLDRRAQVFNQFFPGCRRCIVTVRKQPATCLQGEGDVFELLARMGLEMRGQSLALRVQRLLRIRRKREKMRDMRMMAIRAGCGRIFAPFFEANMHICAADAESAHACAEGSSVGVSLQLVGHTERRRFDPQFRVRTLEVTRSRHGAGMQHHRGLDQVGHARGSIHVADIRL